MRRTSSRSLAAISLLALLTALAVPNRAEAEERANHATSVRMVRDAERDVVRIVVGFDEIPTDACVAFRRLCLPPRASFLEPS